jgi:hypothetical protein
VPPGGQLSPSSLHVHRHDAQPYGHVGLSLSRRWSADPVGIEVDTNAADATVFDMAPGAFGVVTLDADTQGLFALVGSPQKASLAYIVGLCS